MQTDLNNDSNFRNFIEWITLKVPFYEASELDKNIDNLISVNSISDKELRKVISYLIRNGHKDCLDEVIPENIKVEIDKQIEKELQKYNDFQRTWKFWYGADEHALAQKLHDNKVQKELYRIFQWWLDESKIDLRGTGVSSRITKAFCVLLPHLMADSEQRTGAMKQKLDLHQELKLLTKGRKAFLKAAKIDSENPVFGTNTYIKSVSEVIQEKLDFMTTHKITWSFGAHNKDKTILRVYIKYLDEIIREQKPLKIKHNRAIIYYNLFKQLGVDGYDYPKLNDPPDDKQLANFQEYENALTTNIEKHLL